MPLLLKSATESKFEGTVDILSSVGVHNYCYRILEKIQGLP